MVDTLKGGLSLLLKKITWKSLVNSVNTSEEESSSLPPAKETKPMLEYWEKHKKESEHTNQPFIDLFLNDQVAPDTIPDVPKDHIEESHYNYYNKKLLPLLQNLNNIHDTKGVPETPKAPPGISSSGRDASVVATIVVAAISGILILAGLIAVVVYRHYANRNATSMNFDNPVYRKTTEDQFALEAAQKNGYAPGSKLYPSTVGEEAQEPLRKPGTNEFV